MRPHLRKLSTLLFSLSTFMVDAPKDVVPKKTENILKPLHLMDSSVNKRPDNYKIYKILLGKKFILGKNKNEKDIINYLLNEW